MTLSSKLIFMSCGSCTGVCQKNNIHVSFNKDINCRFQSPDFPLSVDMLLNVLEVITPFKHFNKLREFVQMKLPPGFPVKIGNLNYDY